MSEAHKQPYSRTLPAFATQKAMDEIAKLGLAIPGHVISANGPLITVNFDVTGMNVQQMTMPIAGSEYVRIPVQPGDKGIAIPCAFYLGGVSGLGGGVADLTKRGNLSSLVWQPIGNTEWQSVSAGYVVLYGPNGVSIRDEGSTAQIVVSPENISLSAGGHTLIINSSGITLDGIVFAKHEHAAGTLVAPNGPVTGNTGEVSGDGP